MPGDDAPATGEPAIEEPEERDQTGRDGDSPAKGTERDEQPATVTGTDSSTDPAEGASTPDAETAPTGGERANDRAADTDGATGADERAKAPAADADSPSAGNAPADGPASDAETTSTGDERAEAPAPDTPPPGNERVGVPAANAATGGEQAKVPAAVAEVGVLVALGPEAHPPTADSQEEAPTADSLERAPTAAAAEEAPTSIAVPEPTVAAPVRDHGSAAAEPDPLTDIEQRKREAGVDTLFPFGRPGQPIGRTQPFMFGFTAALGVFLAWILIQAIADARQVLVLIVVSMFLAVGLNPAVEALQRARLPRRGAVAVVFMGVLLVFVGVGFAIVPPLTKEIGDFIDHLPTYIEQLQQNQQIRDLDQRYHLLVEAEKAVKDPDFGKKALNGVVGVGKVVLGGVFSTVTVLILTLYFLASLPTIKTFFYRLAPRSRRARVALLGDEILLRIGGYVLGTLSVAMVAGISAYIFLTIMDVPFALPLSLVVGLTALIPLVGATIGAILATSVAFLNGLGTGIACLIFFIIYQQVENYVIHPRVMKRAVDVQPTVTIIAALFGGALLGITGALLAIPTAAAIALIVREVVVPRQDTL